MKRKIVSTLLTLAMATSIVAPAFANTDNYASSTPKVENDTDGVSLGSVIVREDEDSNGFFQNGDTITFTLPGGVTYATVPTVGTLGSYVTITDPAAGPQTLTFVAAGDNFVTVQVTGADNNPLGNEGEARITSVYSGAAVVDIDSEVTGDLKVEVDGAGTTVTSEFVTVGRVVDGATVSTISDVKTIGLDSQKAIGTIKIAETAVGKLKVNNDYIKLVLPNDFKWDTTNLSIGLTGGLAAAYQAGDGTDTLEIKVNTASSGSQAGFLSLSGLEVVVPDDADLGEVEMTVKGNEVTSQDLVVCKVGDFGFKTTVKGSVPTIVAGADDEEIAEINIDDLVAGTWINGRTVTLELPTWAEWSDANPSGDGPLANGTRDADDKEIAKFKANGADGEAALDNLKIDVDADAPAGDLKVKIYGNAGVEAEVVVAKIVAPFEVSAAKPEVTLGVQGQKFGDITLTETQDEAIAKNKWVVVEAPQGFEFSESPDVDVTAGDMDIDNDDIDGRYFAFEVTGDSSKASAIKISNMKFNVDRTVPVGDVVFKIYETTNAAIAGGSISFANAIDKDNYEDLTRVAVATVTNPAPAAGNVMFNIGSSVYTANGVSKVMDAAPYIKDGRTYVPVRYLALALGVSEDNIKFENGVVTLIKGDITLKLTIGDTNLVKNDQTVAMDVAPEVVNGRTMLPARFVAEGFGAMVGYANGQVVISQ